MINHVEKKVVLGLPIGEKLGCHRKNAHGEVYFTVLDTTLCDKVC